MNKKQCAIFLVFAVLLKIPTAKSMKLTAEYIDSISRASSAVSSNTCDSRMHVESNAAPKMDGRPACKNYSFSNMDGYDPIYAQRQANSIGPSVVHKRTQNYIFSPTVVNNTYNNVNNTYNQMFVSSERSFDISDNMELSSLSLPMSLQPTAIECNRRCRRPLDYRQPSDNINRSLTTKLAPSSLVNEEALKMIRGCMDDSDLSQ